MVAVGARRGSYEAARTVLIARARPARPLEPRRLADGRSASCAATSGTRRSTRSSDVPGLLFKAWLSDETTERWGAVYVWESREASEQELPSRARELIGKEPEIIELFDLEASVSVAPQLARLARARGRARMSALRVERDGPLLRVALARPERRNAFDAALIAELTEAFADVGDARAVLLSGDGPSFSAGADVEWMRASADLSLRRERRRRAASARDARVDRRLPRAGRRARAGTCARRRLRPRRVLRHRRRRARRAVRIQRGEARHRPGGDLTVRAGQDRHRRRHDATSSPASASGRGRAPHRARARARSRPRRGRRRGARRAPSAGPEAARPPRRSPVRRSRREETARRIAEHRTSAEGQEGLRAFLEKRPARNPDGTEWGVFTKGGTDGARRSNSA